MLKSFVACIFGSAALLIACSSSSTGTGTKNGGLGALFGNKDGGTAGTTTGDTSSCTIDPTEDACTTCLKQSCCTTLLACANSTECVAIVNCSDTCNDDSTCNNNCVNSHPDGVTPVKALIDCGTASCAGPCNVDGSTTTTPTTGTCLSDPPDDELCSTIPGKTHPKDCPDGPPNSQCVPSPENLHGIYCCP